MCGPSESPGNTPAAAGGGAVDNWSPGKILLASSQIPVLTGGAGNFRPERGERHFRLMPSPFPAFSAPDTFTTFATFSLPFPGVFCLV